jgi:hypothetical protein
MAKRRFGKRLAYVSVLAMTLAAPPVIAQRGDVSLKAGKPLHAGDVLSGELSSMRVRSGNNGKRVVTYEITSEPRRLPPPSGLCDLVTGPETFQLITTNEAQTAQLKRLVGKEVSVRIGNVTCARDVGEMSEAIVGKWTVVAKH